MTREQIIKELLHKIENLSAEQLAAYVQALGNIAVNKI